MGFLSGLKEKYNEEKEKFKFESTPEQWEEQFDEENGTVIWKENKYGGKIQVAKRGNDLYIVRISHQDGSYKDFFQPDANSALDLVDQIKYNYSSYRRLRRKKIDKPKPKRKPVKKCKCKVK